MRQESSADFRERFVAGMRRAASGVAIVTCGEHGATVSAFSSVTDDPPAVMVCLHNSGRTRRAVASRRLFSVNLLASRHAPLADIFAGRTRGEEVCRRGVERLRKHRGEGFERGRRAH